MVQDRSIPGEHGTGGAVNSYIEVKNPPGTVCGWFYLGDAAFDTDLRRALITLPPVR